MARHSRPDLQAAADRMPGKSGLTRDLDRLAAMLWPGETVQAIVAGNYRSGDGLLVATDRRLFFADDGATAEQSADFPYSTIREVLWRPGMLTGALTLRVHGAKAEIAHLDRKTGAELVEYVRARLAAPEAVEPPPAPPATTAAPTSTMEQLTWLVQMHESGVLSDAEFAAAKARLLDI